MPRQIARKVNTKTTTKIARKAVTKTTKNSCSIATPLRMHIDRRAEMILAAIGKGADETLLNTQDAALLLGVSDEWLENGRIAGYGPEFSKLSPRMIRYPLGKLREFLRDRSHLRTNEYRKTA